MSPRVTRSLTVAAALLVLGAVNYSIYGKERIIDAGEVVFLELAPVDPRSLMQGDYMALRFRVAEEIRTARTSLIAEKQRFAELQVDERRIARLAPTQAGQPLRLAFRIRNGEIWLGTNAYFFEEGTGDRYTSARYGEFRVDPSSGDAVLVGLRDETLRRL